MIDLGSFLLGAASGLGVAVVWLLAPRVDAARAEHREHCPRCLARAERRARRR